MPSCRGCGAPIRWATARESGRHIPLNPDPDPEGNVVLEADGRTARVLTGAELPAQETAYRPHWATCERAQEFRASKRAEKDRPRCDVCQDALDGPLLAREPHETHPACDPDAAAARTRWAAERARQANRGRTTR